MDQIQKITIDKYSVIHAGSYLVPYHTGIKFDIQIDTIKIPVIIKFKTDNVDLNTKQINASESTDKEIVISLVNWQISEFGAITTPFVFEVAKIKQRQLSFAATGTSLGHLAHITLQFMIQE